MTTREHPFYDKEVLRDQEQAFIRRLLQKYRNEKVNQDLKKQVYDDLSREKSLGNITIPFRVILKRDSYGKYPDVIEVILDTKV